MIPCEPISSWQQEPHPGIKLASRVFISLIRHQSLVAFHQFVCHNGANNLRPPPHPSSPSAAAPTCAPTRPQPHYPPSPNPIPIPTAPTRKQKGFSSHDEKESHPTGACGQEGSAATTTIARIEIHPARRVTWEFRERENHTLHEQQSTVYCELLRARDGDGRVECVHVEYEHYE